MILALKLFATVLLVVWPVMTAAAYFMFGPAVSMPMFEAWVLAMLCIGVALLIAAAMLVIWGDD